MALTIRGTISSKTRTVKRAASSAAVAGAIPVDESDSPSLSRTSRRTSTWIVVAGLRRRVASASASAAVRSSGFVTVTTKVESSDHSPMYCRPSGTENPKSASTYALSPAEARSKPSAPGVRPRSVAWSKWSVSVSPIDHDWSTVRGSDSSTATTYGVTPNCATNIEPAGASRAGSSGPTYAVAAWQLVACDRQSSPTPDGAERSHGRHSAYA